MTKDLLILGAGGIGAAAASFAAESPQVGRLTVADLSLTAAEAVAAALGGRAKACAVDVNDPQALAALLGSVDTVINCVGPYFRFGPPVLAAAIAAAVTYIDVCDDWDATLAMLEQDAAAKARGVTAIIGMGQAPAPRTSLPLMSRALWRTRRCSSPAGRLTMTPAIRAARRTSTGCIRRPARSVYGAAGAMSTRHRSVTCRLPCPALRRAAR